MKKIKKVNKAPSLGDEIFTLIENLRLKTVEVSVGTMTCNNFSNASVSLNELSNFFYTILKIREQNHPDLEPKKGGTDESN